VIQKSHASRWRAHESRKLLAAVCATAVLPLLIAAASTRSAAAEGPHNCNSSFDPYAYTQAAVAACGYKTFPRTAVKALAGGGSGYDFDVNGHTVEFLVPPAGFQPATATNAQLNEYGLPPRPTASTPLARWHTEMRNFKPASPPPAFLAESHAHAANNYSTNWSGYAVVGGDGAFNHAEIWYTEPTFFSSSCSTNADVTWAGIGGWFGPNDTVGQDGTAHGVPGVDNHQAWWEVSPDNDIIPVPLYGHINYLFDASTRWSDNGYYVFYMYDYESSNYLSFREYITDKDQRSAEAINERPTINGSYSYLSNYQTETVSESQANDTGINNYSPTGGRYGVHMVDKAGGDMADPSGIGSNGYFTITQQRCS
jgi:hypothetical protein